MSPAESSCPKCDKPRLADSLDCPFCGVVYDRYDPERVGGGWAPPAAPTSAASGPVPDKGVVLDEIYQGPSIEELYPEEAAEPEPKKPPGRDLYQGPDAAPAVQSPRSARAISPTPVGRDTFLSRNLGAFLLVAGVVYLLSQALWNAYLVGGTIKTVEVENRFLSITGMVPPEGFTEGGAVRFVGRDFLWFTENSVKVPRMVFLYHRGELAPDTTREVMELEVLDWLQMLEMPMKAVERRKGLVGGSQAEMQMYGIGPAGGRSVAHGGLMGFDTIHGRPAVLFLVASRNDFDALRREFLR